MSQLNSREFGSQWGPSQPLLERVCMHSAAAALVLGSGAKMEDSPNKRERIMKECSLDAAAAAAEDDAELILALASTLE